MIGAIIGDIVGSVYEFDNIKTKDFPILSDGCGYTDETLMTIAVGKALTDHIDNGTELFEATASAMREIAADYPCGRGGYGRGFKSWLDSAEPLPYGSCGNGGAMRVSPCGECAVLARDTLEMAGVTASVTHNHPEGMRGAQAAAMAVFLAMDGATKQEMRNVLRQFYPLNKTLDEIRPYYSFDVTAQGSVPQALEAFLESGSFEDALRNAISIGGDSDTIAAITGSIAWCYYGRNGNADATMIDLKNKCMAMLPEGLAAIVEQWEERFGIYVS